MKVDTSLCGRRSLVTIEPVEMLEFDIQSFDIICNIPILLLSDVTSSSLVCDEYFKLPPSFLVWCTPILFRSLPPLTVFSKSFSDTSLTSDLLSSFCKSNCVNSPQISWGSSLRSMSILETISLS